MRLQWDFDAWEEYCYWQQHNKVILKRINIIISCKGHYNNR